jgi:hypothetical protein
MEKSINQQIDEILNPGRTGYGYYGPPDEGKWMHEKSVRHDTQKEAQESYRKYWEKYHKDEPQGYMDPDDDSYSLCYWGENWGPLAVPEYNDNFFETDTLLKYLNSKGITVSISNSDKDMVDVTFTTVYGISRHYASKSIQEACCEHIIKMFTENKG